MSGQDFGYSQQDPASVSDPLNRAAFIVKQMMAKMDTMKLVKVVAVTAGEGDGDVKAAGTVNVLPLVNQIDGSGNPTKHGVVNGLPWTRMQGGKNAVICDPVVGDIGYVICADRDTSIVRKDKAQANPGSYRRFNIADGVYVGGALNVAPEQYLVFTEDGARLVDKFGNSIAMTTDGMTLTDKSGNVISTTSNGIALTPKSGQPVTVNGKLIVTDTLTAQQNLNLGGSLQNASGALYAGNIHVGGTLTGDTDVVSGAIGLKGHHHNAPAGGGNTGPALP